MKIEPRLPQLPSLGELLEHPRVKGLVERVNRSTVAQRAGGFLEEIRASLAERAGRVEIPSLAHLAERLARRLLGEPAAAGPVINATGLVLDDQALAMPLAEPALHAMVQLAGEYHRRDAALMRAAERGVCELAGGEAAHLTSSFEAAVTLAVAATAGNRELLFCGDLDDGGPVDWRRVAARASAVILAAGSPVAEQAKTSNAAAILRGPNAENVSLTDVASSKPKDAALIDAAPQAGIADPREYGFESVPTIAERLAAGADLVVIDGSGLLGGPACGLILGKHEQIDAVTHHPLNSLLAADPLTIAALTAVLKIARNETGSVAAIFQLPIWQLLTAPQANLEQRARRLAAQLVGASGIATADAREVESAWRRWGNRTWSAKSWCIELRPADGDCDSLAAKLAEGPYPILARIADGTVQLDLRSVFPYWDQQLVTAAEGARGPTVTSPSSGSAAQ